MGSTAASTAALASLSCNQEHIRETLKLRYCSQVSMDSLVDDDDPIYAASSNVKPTKSRIMRKFENVQATLGSELIVSRRSIEHSATLPMLNTLNGAQVILTRSATEPPSHSTGAFGRTSCDDHRPVRTSSRHHEDYVSHRTSDL
ncbi:hypothetical protein H310_04065 [Aphanomyces invadans]|uniref:Uncharacterized protein n=1 Tax=Aphanomyces invadans TaxID=157072 RepID=A0A024UF29_9STRA|nr:hypothetical protein H310_04065 [Aphanomyces invadans]ETW05001.1 hypothetical protein H310_04065 [Aphanomyces invadans]|eukprot:XP_008866439.1 hypothetical protein H310_04065 [Aphanomyces invadans]